MGSHSLSVEELGGDCPHAAAVRQLLRGSGLARPLLLLATNVSDSSGGPPNAEWRLPRALGLLGLTSEMLDPRLTEPLAQSVCACISQKLGSSSPTLQFP